MKFKMQCPSIHTSGRENFFSKLNNHNANMFWSKPIDVRYSSLITFVGGFTDSCFFHKANILALPNKEQEDFLKYLEDFDPKAVEEKEPDSDSFLDETFHNLMKDSE